jgi:hypothetical protein
MTIKIPTITWPTRDGWTANRQARYPDGSLPTRPSNFLTLEEINHLGAELERLRETLTGVAKRRVTEAIKNLRNDASILFTTTTTTGFRQPLAEPILRRQHDAKELFRKVWSQHRDDRPVDDAAWELELQRRAVIEREFATAWSERMTKEAEKATAA